MAKAFTLYSDEALIFLLNSPRGGRWSFLIMQWLGTPTVPSTITENENRSEQKINVSQLPV
jgi:hypothetical protein